MEASKTVHIEQLGSLAAPDAWELRVEVTLLAPKVSSSLPMAKQATSQPRANLTITRRPETGSLEQARERLATDLAQQLRGRGLRDVSRQDVAFEDGARGLALAMIYEGLPGVMIRQTIVLRIDAGTVTQLTATSPLAGDATDASLMPIVRSYRPHA